MSKTDCKRKSFSLISLLASLFVYIGAVAIYFYANGWRVGDINQFFIKTGVLTVESEPFLATVYVDGDEKGRTPKSVSLPIGVYDVSVYRSGYLEWKKSVEIKDQKSTPVYPWLIKEDIQDKEIFLLEGKKYINSWTSKYKHHTYFLINEFDTIGQRYLYSLYRFDLNTTFWDLNNNPRVVLTFESLEQPEVLLSLSPSGTLGVLTITTTDSTNSYLLDSSKILTLDQLPTLNISAFSSYDMTWSKDNKYLMFESDSDLVSFDITKQTRYLLLKKSPENQYLWNTDEQGFFYKVETNTQNTSENTYSYILTQELMDGSSPKTLIQDLYFQTDIEYVKRYRDDTGSGKYAPFTNSPESTKSVGAIESFDVNQNAKGIFIQTETSSYWYNIDTKKYHLASPYPSHLVEISPDNYKLIFEDTSGYWVFTFYKEDGDHTTTIGAKKIDNLGEEVSNISWLSNSSNVIYSKETEVYISDKDGDNEARVLDDTNSLIYFDVTNSTNELITVSLTKNINEELSNISIFSSSIH